MFLNKDNGNGQLKQKCLYRIKKRYYICPHLRDVTSLRRASPPRGKNNGEMAEWSNAAVLKTVEGHTSGGSNPSFSAKGNPQRELRVFVFQSIKTCFCKRLKNKNPTCKACCSFYACPGFLFGITACNPIDSFICLRRKGKNRIQRSCIGFHCKERVIWDHRM